MSVLDRNARAAQLPSRSFTRVPNELFEHLVAWELTPSEGYLYCLLLRRRWGSVDPYPQVRTLAREMGVSVSTVQRAVKQLVRAGLVTVEPRPAEHGGLSSNTYHLHLVAPIAGGTTSHRGQGGGRTKGRGS